MYQFPEEPKKIRARIRRYERTMRKEQEQYGHISDGYGKRYLLGPLYLLMDDVPGAIAHYEWFERTFPDDMGDPFDFLCWSLALYRTGDLPGASHRLMQTMVSNVYLIPHLLGLKQKGLDLWHGSNLEEKDYLQYMPTEILALWDGPALLWAHETYHSPGFCQVRDRYTEILGLLKTEPHGPRRSRLLNEAFRFRTMGLGEEED
jgi:hypothetical protein